MRDIKFRAWDKVREEMAEVTNLDFHPTVVSLSTGTGRDNDEFVLMQYTGLKDKNGVEIYEGDLIARCFDDYEGPSEVVYYNGILCAKHLKTKTLRPLNTFSGCGWARVDNGSNHYDFSVIGNIYENPELLGQQ